VNPRTHSGAPVERLRALHEDEHARLHGIFRTVERQPRGERGSQQTRKTLANRCFERDRVAAPNGRDAFRGFEHR
jgi:hypothetical protein